MIVPGGLPGRATAAAQPIPALVRVEWPQPELAFTVSTARQRSSQALGLVFQVAQQIGRVVGHDQRHALVAVDAAAQLADRLGAAQQALHREAAHRQDDPRLHQLHLADQEGLALRQLVGRRVAVARRAALQRVGDVDLLRRLGLAARQRDRAQHVVEQLAGLADEGLALPVFLLARRFADDHPVRARVADAEDGLAPALAQRAGGAGGDAPRAARASRAQQRTGQQGRCVAGRRGGTRPSDDAATCHRTSRGPRSRPIAAAARAARPSRAASRAGVHSSASPAPTFRLITTASSRRPNGAG